MALEQPDFDHIKGMYAELGEQFALCVNIPAVAEGQRILDILGEIREQGRLMNERLVGIERHMREQDVSAAARDWNVFARFLNSRAMKAEDTLRPFRGIGTNEVIESFPQRLGELDTLPAATVNEVLRGLGEPVDGPIVERRRKLKLLVGVII
ncbi:hypothetical protein F5Y09DRAFT_295935 [Xylaria sp. FL1042]|nr:hypothetical protein F5Y09DRAFT_295935 [Xylaria sp. FL1042]